MGTEIIQDIRSMFPLSSLSPSWATLAHDRLPQILGTLIAMIAEIFALAHWVTARRRFNTNGVDADYGAALWMGLTAAIIAFIG